MKNRGAFIINFILAWLISGTLDAAAAIFILAHGHATAVFRYIASAVFGANALSGGRGMIWAGVAFHYFITACFVALFFVLYSKLPLLRKHGLLVIHIYGSFIWVVMNLIILPLTGVTFSITFMGTIKNVFILSLCIASPAWLFRRRFPEK